MRQASIAEALWAQIRRSARLVEVVAEDGAKAERCQILEDGQWIEIVRIWRQPAVISEELHPIAHPCYNYWLDAQRRQDETLAPLLTDKP